MVTINHKITIMHVVSRLDMGGLENGIVNICNNLDRARFNPMICCLKGEGVMKARLKADVEVFCMNYPEGKHPFRPIHLAGFFNKIKPHIIHTHAWGMGSYEGILGAKIAKTPVIINGEHGSFFLKKHQVFIQRLLAIFCDEILSVSSSLKKEIVNKIGIPSKKIKVIYNGVDETVFTGNHDTTDLRFGIKERCDVSLDDESFVIGCIGSLKPEKNQMMLLNALLRCNSIRPTNTIKVIFLGDGPDRTLLETFVKKNKLNKQVIFLGQRNDIPIVLSLVDLLVSTSVPHWEGLSNVILEAMSSGVPVIATNSVGNNELVREGMNGYLIPSQNAVLLAERIDFMYSNSPERRRMSNNARTMVRDNFSIKKMIASYDQLYWKSIQGRAH